MRITAIEPFVCDGGLREFGFLKVTTDEGIVGWAETYDWHTSASLKTALEVMGRRLIGEDPRRIELDERADLVRRPAGRPGTQKVLAAIDLALWDIKAKWLGVPVYELLGGKFRDRIPLYWSHFATYRGGLAGGRRPAADPHVRRMGGRRPRRGRPGLQGPEDEPHRGGRPGRQGAAAALPRRRDRPRGRSTTR